MRDRYLCDINLSAIFGYDGCKDPRPCNHQLPGRNAYSLFSYEKPPCHGVVRMQVPTVARGACKIVYKHLSTTFREIVKCENGNRTLLPSE